MGKKGRVFLVFFLERATGRGRGRRRGRGRGRGVGGEGGGVREGEGARGRRGRTKARLSHQSVHDLIEGGVQHALVLDGTGEGRDLGLPGRVRALEHVLGVAHAVLEGLVVAREAGRVLEVLQTAVGSWGEGAIVVIFISIAVVAVSNTISSMNNIIIVFILLLLLS